MKEREREGLYINGDDEERKRKGHAEELIPGRVIHHLYVQTEGLSSDSCDHLI